VSVAAQGVDFRALSRQKNVALSLQHLPPWSTIATTQVLMVVAMAAAAAEVNFRLAPKK
jgi:hypothetical protein